MDHGFPFDEVNPFTCEPVGRDFEDSSNTWKNDAMGNFSLTLFDSLDTFVVIGDKQGFWRNVQLIKDTYTDFDIDSNIQVFETNIRILGGLLSAHLYASDERRGFSIDNYDGFLLKLAYDMGKRLVLAFENKSGVPFPRTNLKYGPQKVPKNLQREQCTAGITSLILEFGLLSRLTNDPIFELVSRRTYLNLWSSKTGLGFLPMSVDARSNVFTDQVTGVGASIDSFYEYALKYSILFDDEVFSEIWQQSYQSLLTYSQNSNRIFANIHVSNGATAREWIDALGAFFPGLLVLAGDLDNAFHFYLVYFKLWNSYGAIPERWDFSGSRWEFSRREQKTFHPHVPLMGLTLDETKDLLMKDSVLLEWFPLRPEFVESTYFLYRATKDPFFLRVGEAILERYETDFRAPCGFAGIEDIRIGTRQSRMESFVLSETLKYLYLLFDDENDLHNTNGAAVFSTEAHPFWFDEKLKIYDLKQDIQIPKTQDKGVLEEFWNRLFANPEPQEVDIQFAKLRNETAMFPDYVSLIMTPESENALIKANVKYPDDLEYGKRFYVSPKVYEILKPSLITVATNEVLDSMGLTLDPDYLGLNTCRRVLLSRPFLKSKILEYPLLYKLDYKYQPSLQSPGYYRNTSDVEIADNFYSLFGDNQMVSYPSQTSEQFDALIGTLDKVTKTQIYRIKAGPEYDLEKSAVVPILPQDLYVPQFDNLRMSFERLEPGRINAFGGAIQTDDYNCTLRLLKLNGYNLDEEDIVWVDQNWFQTANRYANIRFSSNGFVTINGESVMNLRIIPNLGGAQV
ncbi:hypothetical protein OGAPHI_002217 [Ogataea philodendri]|uniref:alpha-1,2-Mannosidase n=1 Tax=Ogataea philodendri TaxID=1378263 RepID=A0A9P8T6U1_9ASCO|nr:uncharacterized protein OGAPHI_002217 [Ogataea philodendri]KAH3668463.1 hypothetical protein OGAPHI_002217 [Ogataea philodendri]